MKGRGKGGRLRRRFSVGDTLASGLAVAALALAWFARRSRVRRTGTLPEG